jgi:large subunit ribosomal protein L29
MMNIEEMRSLNDADLAQEIETQREEWRNLRFQNALGRLTTFHQISDVRKMIARLKTIQREREIALAPEKHFAATTKLRARRRREKQAEALARRQAERRAAANKGRRRRV